MTYRKLVPLVIAAALLLAAGPARAYEVAPAPDGGAVRGKVRFRGQAPKPVPVKIPARLPKADADFCRKQQLVTEDVVVAADGGLANVVVAVEGITRGKAPARRDAELANRNCRFDPRVQSVTVGGKLVLSNHDPFLHNTHLHWARDNATVWNIALPDQGARVSRAVKKPGLMRVGCDAGHTWMSAFIVAFDHPYHAVTAANGEFSLEALPPGTYKLVVWHEKLGTKRLEVKVPPSGRAAVAIAYP